MIALPYVVFRGIRPELLDPGIQTMGCHTEPAGHIGHTVAAIYYLFNCFNLELIWVSLFAHNHLCHSHFVWLRGV